MKTYLAVAMGSALGGMARHGLTVLMVGKTQAGFPWGTFLVNALGSLLIGAVFAFPQERLGQGAREFLAIGVLGGFTTFSAFSVQTFSMIQSGRIALAAGYAFASVGLCVFACALGWWVSSKAG